MLNATCSIRLGVFVLLTAPAVHGQLLTAPARLLVQGADGLDDAALDGEDFGAAVAFGDFDCDGFGDLAVGVPRQDLVEPGTATITDAGAVHVIYGSSSGLSARNVVLYEADLPHPSALSEDGDRFGTALVSGNFDDDDNDGVPCDDLAAGSPFEDGGSLEASGAVFVLFGDPAGLSASRAQLWTQGGSEVRGVVEAGDLFGETLAVGDFDGDGYDDLAVGAPGEQLDNGPAEGAVWAFRGGPTGLSAPNLNNSTWLQLIHQDLAGLEDVASPGDRFGGALTACDIDDDGRDDLVIGVPGETGVAAQQPVAGAGGIHTLFGSIHGLDLEGDDFEPGTQLDAAMGSALAGGDLDIYLPAGPGCEIAVGHPFQDVNVAGSGLALAAGQVTLHKPVRGGSPFGSSFALFTETSFQGETPEGDEYFGHALATADLDGDGYDEVLIGAPGEGGTFGAVFWFPALQPAKAAYRIGDFDFGTVGGFVRNLGGVMAVGDVDGDGRPEVALGMPDYDFFGAGITQRVFLGAPGAVLFAGSAGLLRDGFESGDTGAWSNAIP